MKISKSKITGLSIIVLGIAMRLIPRSMFSYSGSGLNPIIHTIGMYFYFLWLPTIIVGVVLVIFEKKVSFYLGVFLMILGIIMFCIGVSTFTYQGNNLSPFISNLGMYSFLYWMETAFTGGALMLLSKLFPKK
jgi:hypothetical protein